MIKDVVQKSSLLLFAPVAAPVRPCARRGRSARVALRRRMGSRAPPRRLRGGERRGKNRPWLQGKLLSTEGSERRRRQRAQQSEKKSREPRSIFVALAPRRRLHCLYQGSNGKHGPAGAVTRRVEAMAELENGAAGEDEGGVEFGVEERVNQRQRGRGGRREKKKLDGEKTRVLFLFCFFFPRLVPLSLSLSLSPYTEIEKRERTGQQNTWHELALSRLKIRFHASKEVFHKPFSSQLLESLESGLDVLLDLELAVEDLPDGALLVDHDRLPPVVGRM